MFHKKSESIRDLIKFYECGTPVKRYSSFNLTDKPLKSTSNLDKSSTSSYSSKSSSSMSLSVEDGRKVDLTLVSSSLKENYKPLRRTETFAVCKDHSLRQDNVANLSKRKSMSFYVSKTSAKNGKSILGYFRKISKCKIHF